MSIINSLVPPTVTLATQQVQQAQNQPAVEMVPVTQAQKADSVGLQEIVVATANPASLASATTGTVAVMQKSPSRARWWAVLGSVAAGQALQSYLNHHFGNDQILTNKGSGASSLAINGAASAGLTALFKGVWKRSESKKQLTATLLTPALMGAAIDAVVGFASGKRGLDVFGPTTFIAAVISFNVFTKVQACAIPGIPPTYTKEMDGMTVKQLKDHYNAHRALHQDTKTLRKGLALGMMAAESCGSALLQLNVTSGGPESIIGTQVHSGYITKTAKVAMRLEGTRIKRFAFLGATLGCCSLAAFCMGWTSTPVFDMPNPTWWDKVVKYGYHYGGPTTASLISGLVTTIFPKLGKGLPKEGSVLVWLFPALGCKGKVKKKSSVTVEDVTAEEAAKKTQEEQRKKEAESKTASEHVVVDVAQTAEAEEEEPNEGRKTCCDRITNCFKSCFNSCTSWIKSCFGCGKKEEPKTASSEASPVQNAPVTKAAVETAKEAEKTKKKEKSGFCSKKTWKKIGLATGILAINVGAAALHSLNEAYGPSSILRIVGTTCQAGWQYDNARKMIKAKVTDKPSTSWSKQGLNIILIEGIVVGVGLVTSALGGQAVLSSYQVIMGSIGALTLFLKALRSDVLKKPGREENERLEQASIAAGNE